MHGLSEIEIETMIRLAAAACDEAARGVEDPFAAALASFGDPSVVRALGVRTWKAIEADTVF